MDVDACHIRAAKRQLLAQQLDRLDAGMGEIAGGVIFEERLHDHAARTRQWCVRRWIGIALGRNKALRHFEHLSNAEAAEVLGIKEGAAGKRYLRALERLRETLANMPGGLEL